MPWLNLEAELLRQCIRGEQEPLLVRLADIVHTLSGPLVEIEDKDVLSEGNASRNWKGV